MHQDNKKPPHQGGLLSGDWFSKPAASHIEWHYHSGHRSVSVLGCRILSDCSWCSSSLPQRWEDSRWWPKLPV